MKDSILSNLGNPAELEQLYRQDKPGFTQAFDDLYHGIAHHPVATFWRARLTPTAGREQQQNFSQWFLLAGLCLVAGLIAKLPFWLPVSMERFYLHNVGFIIVPALAAWFAIRNKIGLAKIVGMLLIIGLSAVFINLLPDMIESDTTLLACIHLLVVLWFLLGFAHTGGEWRSNKRRLDFLRFNGDLLVITGLIVIAGGLVTALTLALFRAIGLSIENFYFDNIVVFALPAAPLIGNWLTENNPQLVSRISTVIARIFTPLVLVMLVAYLVAVAVSSRNPFNDREFLLVFNALLIAVMALIFFSVSGNRLRAMERWELLMLLALVMVTILVNGIALVAIILRISEWGFSPNRVAIMGLNMLMLVNLVLVSVSMARVLAGKRSEGEIGTVMAAYLPVYLVWAMIITIVFPVASGFQLMDEIEIRDLLVSCLLLGIK